jgi:hypothetical protein
MGFDQTVEKTLAFTKFDVPPKNVLRLWAEFDRTAQAGSIKRQFDPARQRRKTAGHHGRAKPAAGGLRYGRTAGFGPGQPNLIAALRPANCNRTIRN